MKKIYGNEYLLSTLETMTANGKAAHAVMLCGEKGSGRKTVADYYTRLLLCENITDGRPCGVCNACTNIDKGFHPDVKYVEKSGKLGKISVDTAREICTDAFVKPNNRSGKKVYVFADCVNMDIRTQNTLLKLIEEPPDYAYFIFTTDEKSNFLPTVISRCVCFTVSCCSEEQTRMALEEQGYGEREIDEATGCFHGNIGRCAEYLSDGRLRKNVELTKRIADSIIRKDEYALSCALFSVGKERSDVKEILSLMDLLVRDAAVLGKDRNSAAVGCWRDGAVRLSENITAGQAAAIHRLIEKAAGNIEFNVSVPLALACLSGEIMNRL